MVRSLVPLAALLVAALPACGRDGDLDMCPPGAAVSSHSEPVVLFTGQVRATHLRTDSTHLYWLASVAKGGGQTALLRGPKDASSPPIRLFAGELSTFALDTSDVYVPDRTSGDMLRVPKSGGKATKFYSGTRSSTIKQIIVDSTAVFARIDTPSRKLILRIPKDGRAATAMETPGVNEISGILADDASLYLWTTGTAGFSAEFRLLRLPKTGGPMTEVLRGPSQLVYHVDLVEGWLFWASEYAIMKAPVGGGARSWLASTSDHGFTVDRTHVYFGSDVLFRAPLAGGTAEKVAKLQYHALTSDMRDLYFTKFDEEGFVAKLSK